MTIIDKRGLTKDSYIIARVKNGVPIDDFYEPLTHKTKKPFKISSIVVPAGSYIGYLVHNACEVETLFNKKADAILDYRSSKKTFKELSVSEIYMDKDGEVIDSMVIKGRG
jgi:hypothetical protein